ncbi:MAG: peptide chain release factor N(5)-glutamine methyltransferase [Pedobacter sp.]|nr:MAG: peptide chain release factor N(5)-glutamine methyltransferase [Pedobacter sp.]
MKIKDIAQKFADDLVALYDGSEAKTIFMIAIDHFLKIDRGAYSLKKENALSSEQVSVLEKVLEDLKTGRPIQYIIGETFFYGLPFKVNKHVLIPRPETEELVEWVLETVFGKTDLNVLDIGTGSGCIPITLKKYLLDSKVSGIDISTDALAVAKDNAILNKTEVTLLEDDVLNSKIIPDCPYHIIISNPPYITVKEMNQMHSNVLENEPHIALFVSDEKPLLFYEAIAAFALKNLHPNGFLFFEINEHLGKETVQMLVDKGFKNIILRKDIPGKDRMIRCNVS